MVAPLKAVPGRRPWNGFGTCWLRNASLALSRTRDVDRNCIGIPLISRRTGRSEPREPRYVSSTTQPRPRSRWIPACQRT